MRRIARSIPLFGVVLTSPSFGTPKNPARLAGQPAVDTTRYAVVEYGRSAGETVIVRAGETTTVRYHTYLFDERIEAQYRILANGTVIDSRISPLGPDGRVTGVTSRIELVGDSVRLSGPTGTSTTRVEPGAYYGHAVRVG